MTSPLYQLRTSGGSLEDSGNELSRLLNTWLTTYGPPTIFKTCQSCKHMSEEGPAYCDLWKVTPPATVIIAACPSHQDKEEIPF